MILLLCCVAILFHLLGLPWWIMFIVIFAVAFFKPVAGKRSFLRGFLSMFIAWFVLCIWSGIQNDHIMASRIASLLGLPNWILLVISTALLGGLTGGLSALAGNYMYNWMRGIKTKYLVAGE
ncbi:MAG: hypothetical protein WCF67_06725 [Chitinophagaceae bacterium]